jgi:hypothetical protein
MTGCHHVPRLWQKGFQAMVPRIRIPACVALAGVLALALTTHARADAAWQAAAKQEWVFPPGMKVQSVRDFGAVGDGKADDTEALRKAFNQTSAFVYLPNGTYLVRDQIQYTHGPSVGPTIQGQSRDGVVIRLADDARGFDDAAQPRPVVRLIRDGRVSADYFKTRIRNLTIDTGKHRGATALMFYANNNGQVRNVRLVGQGAVGLDLSYMLNGPLLVSNVEVDGFDVGIKSGSGPFNSQTLEHIVLKNQRHFGLDNDGCCLMIRDLRFSGSAQPVRTHGNMVLVDSRLRGDGSQAAGIVYAGRLYVRNLTTERVTSTIQRFEHERRAGFGSAIGEAVRGPAVREWSSEKPLVVLGSPDAMSLNLPVEVAPHQPLDTDFNNWVLVDDFGAVGDGRTDDSEALQRALAHAAEQGKTTVAFRANARYIANGELVVRGSVNRLQGAGSYLLPSQGQTLRVVVADGKDDVVVFSLLDRPLGRHRVTIDNASSRTLVVHHFRSDFVGSGTGRSFLEDASSNIFVTNPRHRIWARQVNPEDGARINNENHGGTLWILGLKTERNRMMIQTTRGGKTEVLGAWVYQTLNVTPTEPLFEVIDAQASFAGILQYHWQGRHTYPVLIKATRNGRSVEITPDDNEGRKSMVLGVVP